MRFHHKSRFGLLFVSVCACALEGTATDSTGFAASPVGRFKVVVQALDKTPGEPDILGINWLYFCDRFVISAAPYQEPNSTERRLNSLLFDLDSSAWYDAARKKWVSLDECKKWELDSLKRAEAKLQGPLEADDKSFIESVIYPNPRIEEDTDGGLTVTSGAIKVWISPTRDVAPERLKQYFAFGRLSAYHKAMTTMDLPPQHQLMLNDLSAQHQLFPARITTRIENSKGGILTTVSYKIEPINDTEVDYVSRAVKLANP